jgi:hypothetical protein
MKITFNGEDGSLVLVAQSHEAEGVWFGPFGVSSEADRLFDRKNPIEAGQAVIRAMLNESGRFTFSAHCIAATPTAAAQVVFLHRLSVPKRNGALVVATSAGTFQVCGDCAIARVRFPELTGHYVVAEYTVEF